MRVYLGAFPAAQVARSPRTRPPRLECPRRRRVCRDSVACMQSDAASHILWLQPSRQCGISALNAPDPAPTPGAPVPFGSAQPSHGCVRDTDQLVYIHRIDITDAETRQRKKSPIPVPPNPDSEGIGIKTERKIKNQTKSTKKREKKCLTLAVTSVPYC